MSFAQKFETMKVPEHLIGEVFGTFAQEAAEIKTEIVRIMGESEPELTAMPPTTEPSIDEILWEEWLSRPHNLEARQESGLYGLMFNSDGECVEYEVLGD